MYSSSSAALKRVPVTIKLHDLLCCQEASNRSSDRRSMMIISIISIISYAACSSSRGGVKVINLPGQLLPFNPIFLRFNASHWLCMCGACCWAPGMARPPQLQLKLHIIITTLTYCGFPSLPATLCRIQSQTCVLPPPYYYYECLNLDIQYTPKTDTRTSKNNTVIRKALRRGRGSEPSLSWENSRCMKSLWARRRVLKSILAVGWNFGNFFFHLENFQRILGFVNRVCTWDLLFHIHEWHVQG